MLLGSPKDCQLPFFYLAGLVVGTCATRKPLQVVNLSFIQMDLTRGCVGLAVRGARPGSRHVFEMMDKNGDSMMFIDDQLIMVIVNNLLMVILILLWISKT